MSSVWLGGGGALAVALAVAVAVAVTVAVAVAVAVAHTSGRHSCRWAGGRVSLHACLESHGRQCCCPLEHQRLWSAAIEAARAHQGTLVELTHGNAIVRLTAR